MNFQQTARMGSSAVLLAVMAAGGACASRENITNARLEPRQVSGGLEATLRSLAATQTEPAWVAYAVPAVSSDHEICCSSSWGGDGSLGWCGECRLEGGDGVNVQSGGSGKHEADLEPSHNVLVFLRVANRAVEEVRVFSENCQINAGGRKVYWLTGVSPAESVKVLSSLATGSASGLEEATEDNRVTDGAVLAIALQSDPLATEALNSFVAAGQPKKLREQAAFWLASARGRQGLEVVRRLARNDPDDEFRQKLMFDLSVSSEPEAVDALIKSGHSDSSSRVRGQALFWLAQKAGKKAPAAISDAIENDPEIEVKKRAVFALSQIPKDQGVPLLIQTARTNSNPAVRKAAMFWLGQSNDPRALAFFEQVLTQK
jgi:HEAT repeat protein